MKYSGFKLSLVQKTTAVKVRGFTLVGVLIVLLIIAILASGGIVLFTRKTKTAIQTERSAIEKAEDAKSQIDEKQSIINDTLK